MRDSNVIIEAMASEYISLFVIDLQDEVVTVYRMDNRTYGESDEQPDKTAIIAYLKKFVDEVSNEDKKKMQAYASLELIRRSMSDKMRITKYVKMDSERLQYMGVRFLRIMSENREKIVIGIYDITEREVLQQKYKNANTMYRHLLNSQTSGLLAYRLAAHSLVFMNKEAMRIYDWKGVEDAVKEDFASEIMRVRFSDANVIDRLKSLKIGDDPIEYEFSIKHEDGEELSILSTTRLVAGFDNEPTVISTLHDITHLIILEKEKKSIEEKQKKEELQLATIAEAIHGGFKTGKNDSGYTINYVSEQLAAMLGYTVEEFFEASGGTMSGIVNREDAIRELPKAMASIDNGEMYTMNYRMRCKDGSWKNVEDRGRLICTPDGEDEFWCFIADKDDMMEKSRALEAAKRANASKTIFLNNMSHDIRTPMNAILGFAELMEKNTDNQEIISDYVKKIQSAGEYLLTIINNVLDMAKIESGNTVLDEEFMDVLDPKNCPFDVFDETLKKKQLNFSATQDIKNRYVFIDATKVKQITVNLLSNAIKYTPDGGSISMHQQEIPCALEGYATYVTTISDTGIGMSKGFCEHVFDYFTRERNTTESKVAGTGLGMSIVKKLVDLMGGSIEVDSEPGKGTTFTVTISHRVVQNPEEYLKDQLSEHYDSEILKGKRILLAEDNELNAEIATIILEDSGMVVEHAWDGVQCIDMLREHPGGYYNLILMDIQMPNLNGYMAASKIRLLADEKKAGIPIIAMTANAFEEDKREAIKYGMDGHIAKPIKTEELMRQLSVVLN